ncbi:Mrp/NBP35 family ATP-binding protein [Methanolapillus millepedarum]|uniref:Iron-sulfur cluster carrier protein n=1 Tax=Methanolapillus millepedarum TaxID=3028296 RepID=A0AA96V2K0_9EURY|nr:Iron-sulfur cluster carrier protein [Methanosarcinaceae archaeon Ac7]
MADVLNVVNKKPANAGGKEKGEKISENLALVQNIFVVMSGKGGVGKSTVAAALAAGLALRGNHVGLADCDFHGPTIPAIFGMTGENLSVIDNKMIPVRPAENVHLGIISIGLLLPDDDMPVIWRGPAKTSAIHQFFEDVDWGNLDYLIIDLPPGTGDEPLGIVQLIKNLTGAVVVTIPQDVALASVRKSLTFLQKVDVEPVGIVSNMDGIVCPHCDEKIALFGAEGVQKAAKDFNTTVLAQLPLDPEFSKAQEDGKMLEWMMKDSVWKTNFEKVLDAVEKKAKEKKP